MEIRVSCEKVDTILPVGVLVWSPVYLFIFLMFFQNIEFKKFCSEFMIRSEGEEFMTNNTILKDDEKYVLLFYGKLSWV